MALSDVSLLTTTLINETNFAASSLYTVSTVVDASKNLALVVPFLAELDGTSTAAMNVLQVAQSTSQDVHAMFKAVLSEEECVKLLNAFDLKEANEATGTGTGNTANNQDVSFNVVLDNSGDFADVLSAAMMRAVVVTGCGDDDKDISAGSGACFHGRGSAVATDISSSAAAYMREKMRDYINLQLTKIGPLASIIIPTNISSVGVDLAAGAGAEDMAKRIIDGSDAQRRLLLSQIPAETLQHYITSLFMPYQASGDVQPSFLPMKGGDEITFVFVTKVTDPDSISINSGNVVNGQNAGVTPAGGYSSPFLNGQVVRRLGFVLQLGEKQAFFKRNIAIPSAAICAMAASESLPGVVAGEHIFDLSQALVDAAPMAARLPYTLSTTWSDASANAATAFLQLNHLTVGTPARILFDISSGATAVRDAVAAKTGVNPSAEFLALPGATAAVVAYNNAIWKYALLKAANAYEIAHGGDYLAGASKSWSTSLNGSLAAKAPAATSNGY